MGGGVMSHGDNRPCGGWEGRMFYVARKDGETARKQWTLYKNERANLDAVFIVTWNDWTEGSIVEPSVERGLQDDTIIEEAASGFKDLPSHPAVLISRDVWVLMGALTRVRRPNAKN